MVGFSAIHTLARTQCMVSPTVPVSWDISCSLWAISGLLHVCYCEKMIQLMPSIIGPQEMVAQVSITSLASIRLVGSREFFLSNFNGIPYALIEVARFLLPEPVIIYMFSNHAGVCFCPQSMPAIMLLFS